MAKFLIHYSFYVYSLEDLGKLRVSLYKGTGGSHPREGRPVHIHEGMRRSSRD